MRAGLSSPTGKEQPDREGPLHRLVGLSRRSARRQRSDTTRTGLDPEVRDGRRQEQCGDGDEADDWAAHDPVDDVREEPRAAGRLRPPKLRGHEPRDAALLDPVTQKHQHRRQERQCCCHRGRHDEDCAGGQTEEDRGRHDQETDESYHDRDAGEEDGPARRARGHGDRRFHGRALLAGFPVAGGDEEHVVDPDREPHHRDHVRDEERELVALPDQRRRGQRNHDGNEREHDRQHRRNERPEYDEQHDQCDRDADRLAFGEVALGDGVRVVARRRLPGYLGVEAAAGGARDGD
jgi:hypothetical protein